MRGLQSMLPSALVFMMLASGSGVLGVGVTGRPPDLQIRGALLGLFGSVLGMSAFALGVMYGRTGRVEKEPTESDRSTSLEDSSPRPQEAKYWLQRFLDEHQRRRSSY